MKILLTDIHHGNGGGHVTYILALIAGLRPECDITVAAPATGRLMQRVAEIPGVRAVPTLYTSRLPVMMREVRALRAFLEAERFDIVHVNASADHRHVMLAVMGMKQRPRVIWTKHNTNGVTSVGHRLRAFLATDAVIAVSQYVNTMLLDSPYRRLPLHVVQHGVDAGQLQPQPPAARQAYRAAALGALDPGTVVFGSVAGTDFSKGWHVLVQALGRLEPALRARARVIVAGDPPPPRMLGMVEAAGMSDYVHFTGLVTDIRPVLGACDVGFVLSFRESASYACYETMAMGLPALVSDAGGLPENVRPGTDGWVVPTGDVDALESVLREILHRPEVLPQMGAEARMRVTSAFSLPRFVQATRQVYQTALPLAREAPAPI